MHAIRVWKGLIKTSDQDLIDLGFPQLVGVLRVEAPAFDLAVEEAIQNNYLTPREASKFQRYSKDYDPYETNEIGGDMALYTKHIESSGVGFNQEYSLEVCKRWLSIARRFKKCWNENNPRSKKQELG